jgi:hypothetical protein
VWHTTHLALESKNARKSLQNDIRQKRLSSKTANNAWSIAIQNNYFTVVVITKRSASYFSTLAVR